MVYDFYQNRLWSDLYDRVIWLPLRKLKLMENQACDTVELIQKEFTLNGHGRNFAERLREAVIDSQRTLFILDGLDEVSYTLDPDSSIGHVLSSLLGRPHVVITSRPHSTSILDNGLPDLELETIGFFPQQVDQYIHRVTGQTKTSDKAVSEIQSIIRNRPLVQSQARIPIQLDAICYSWNTRHFPKDNVTMTALYKAISQRLWAKDVVRLGKMFDGKLITRQQIQQTPDVEIFVKDENRFLQELAFQGLCNEVIDFNITDIGRLQPAHQMLGDCPVHMSFLHSSDNSLEASDRTLHFIHLTFQEFFAARYFVRHWVSGTALSLQRSLQGRHSSRSTEQMKPEEFLTTGKYIGRYDIFWRFVVGLLQAEADHNHLHRFFDVLQGDPIDLIGLTHQRLTIHCLSEVSPANGEFQPKVRKLEDIYLQWILRESRLKKAASQSSLMWEGECSDYILETLLKNSETASKVMEMLCFRPTVSSYILNMVLQALHGSMDTKLRRAAIRVLGVHCSQSQGGESLNFWRSVQHSTQAEGLGVAHALRNSRTLQQPAVDSLVALLQHADESVRSEAAWALSHQTSLPSSAVDTLVTLVHDPDKEVRFKAAQVLAPM